MKKEIDDKLINKVAIALREPYHKALRGEPSGSFTDNAKDIINIVLQSLISQMDEDGVLTEERINALRLDYDRKLKAWQACQSDEYPGRFITSVIKAQHAVDLAERDKAVTAERERIAKTMISRGVAGLEALPKGKAEPFYTGYWQSLKDYGQSLQEVSKLKV